MAEVNVGTTPNDGTGDDLRAAFIKINDRVGTEVARATAAEGANADGIAAHAARTDNPHTVTKAQVGLGSADNTADADKPVSVAQAAALALKAPLASPTFTGTVSGVTKAMVGLGSADNTTDADKPVSVAQAAALALKAPLASPTFTGTVSGVTKAMVGLGSADNTADADKPVSVAQAAAIAAEALLRSDADTALGATVVAETTRAEEAEDMLEESAGILIPLVGSPHFEGATLHFTPSGELVGVVHDQDILIPQVGNAEVLYLSPFGESVGYDPVETPATDVEVRPLAGVITGIVTRQLFQRKTNAAWVPLTNGPEGVQLSSVDAGLGVAAVLRNGASYPIKWRTTPLSDGATMHLLITGGQSLAQGYVDTSPATNGALDRYPAWRDLVGERAWQFKAGDGVQRGPRPFQLAPDWDNRNTVIVSTQLETLELLRGSLHAENPKYAQTSSESLAAALISQHLHPRDHVLTAIVGTGATPISDFAPPVDPMDEFDLGSEHMQSIQAIITAAAVQAAARGLALKVWFIWNQGEQDNAIGTSQATYEAAWIAIRNRVSARAIAAGGTFGGAVIQQCSQRPASATGMATLAHAALIMAGEAAGAVHYSMLPGHSGAAHLFPETYLPLGSQTAWAISRLIEAGSTTPYVAAGGATLVDSTTIDCVFSNRDGAMQFDTDTIPDDGQHGVKVTDNEGDVPIASMAWTGAGTLRLTLADPTLIGVAPIVSFGLSGSNVLLPGASGPRVNIRDGSEWPCPITGQIVSGWVLQHQVAVVAP